MSEKIARSLKRISARPPATQAFKIVKAVGLTLPDVEATTRYDGSPVPKLRGVFFAGMATHPWAAPDTLVVRSELEDRELLIADAPATYYVTDYYARYPSEVHSTSHSWTSWR